MVLRRERAVDGRELVVVEAIDKDGQICGKSQSVKKVHTHAMAALGVGNGSGTIGNSQSSGSTHCFMTCSSVLTENFLYEVNWCKLRQCCRGVSTSTRAWVGNQ